MEELKKNGIEISDFEYLGQKGVSIQIRFGVISANEAHYYRPPKHKRPNPEKLLREILKSKKGFLPYLEERIKEHQIAIAHLRNQHDKYKVCLKEFEDAIAKRKPS